MVVKKKPVVKKRKVKKGKTTKTLTKSGKGGNVSQVVNVYVSKATRQRRASAPKQFTPAIQPQMYNAGQENMILGLRQQNKTLMDILNKQRIADTTPNSDIQSLENLVVKKLQPTKPEPVIKKRDEEVDYGGVASVNPKYLPEPQNVVIDTTSRQNVSDMLSSIAEGMDEIPQGDTIKRNILQIGDQIRPQGIRVRIAEIDELDEKNQLENDFYKLRTQLQNQRQFDNSIKMSDYRTLPKKVSTLRVKVGDMRNTLNQSLRLTADEI